MTARDDNDEGLSSITIQHSIKFQNACLCMSMYSQELSIELYILHEGTYILVSTILVPNEYKLHSRFLHLRKFRLVISSTRVVIFNSFKPCLHFVGRWQTVQTQIRRHGGVGSGNELIQKIKMGNSIRHVHVWVNIKCVNG